MRQLAQATSTIAWLLAPWLLAATANQLAGQPPAPRLPTSPRAPRAPAEGSPRSVAPANDHELSAQQQRLQRRFDELKTRFRDLAQELRETEPEQAARVADALAEAEALRLDDRLRETAERLERGDRESALELQRHVLVDLTRLQRRLLTGSAEPPPADDLASALSDLAAELLAQQKPLTATTRELAGRRPDDGAWRRADRLTLARVASQERALADKAAPFLERLVEKEVLAVIRAVLDQTCADLREIATGLAEGRADPALLNRQRDVELALAELLKALRPAQAKSESLPAESPSSNDEGGGNAELPRSVQLRLLRAAQLRVQERTRAFDASRAGQPSTDAANRELEQLARRQADLETELRRLLEQPPY